MNFKSAKDSELANEAQTGFKGQGAIVEAMNRLKDSVIDRSEMIWL